MSKPKYKYLMDYIDDKDTFKAVMFAADMIKHGKGRENAIRTASKYYNADMSAVAHYLGQRGGRRNAEKK